MKSSRALLLVVVYIVLLSVGFRVFWLASNPSNTADASVSKKVSTQPRAELPQTITPFNNSPATLPSTLEGHKAIAAFENWLTEELRQGFPLIAPARLREAVVLAQARRAAMLSLIKADPAAALRQAIPRDFHDRLAVEIRAELETPVDGRGDLFAVCSCFGALPEHSHTLTHEAVIDGRRYTAHVYGRRAIIGSKYALPLHGVALDSHLAVDDRPLRMLEPLEKSAAGFPAEATVALVGSEVRLLENPGEAEVLMTDLAKRETGPGPFLLPASSETRPAVTDWTTGVKRVLWMRVEFPDDPGLPATDAQIQDTMTEVSEFYRDVSGDRSSFTTAIFPGAIRLSRPKSYYDSRPDSYKEISAEARLAARTYDVANGGTGSNDPDKYDRWIVLYRKLPQHTTYAGLGSLGSAGLWLNGDFSPNLVAHELGHNHGLEHSHAWKPTGTQSIAPGEHVEYGDGFDVMGNAVMNNTYSSLPASHFNVSQKAKLGYLEDKFTTTTATGTYRIFRHDARAATGKQALVVPAGNDYDYWIEHRQQLPDSSFASTSRLRSGVLLHWGKRPAFTSSSANGTYLLDCTPISAAGMADAPLAIGETFTDPTYGLNFTPIAQGGISPAEWIDVRVEIGTNGTNRNPVLIASMPAAVPARTDVVFSASATDADGDNTIISWDFGDGIVRAGANVSWRWFKGGSYTVTAKAVDGRGGIALRTVVVDVVDPLLTWVRRSGGVSTDTLKDVIYASGRFIAVGSSYFLMSPDGVSWSRVSGGTNVYYSAIASGAGGRLVAVGERYDFARRQWIGGGGTSIDGVSWTACALQTQAGRFTSVAFGGGKFVAVGTDGRIAYSVDGLNWTEATSGSSQRLDRVRYNAGMFVVVGNAGTLLTSVDGIAWQNRSVVSPYSLSSLVYHAGQWLLGPNTQDLWTSPNAIAWTREPQARGINWLNLSHSGRLVLAPGYGEISIAEDGTWTSVALSGAGFTAFYAIAEGNGTFVVVGELGAIFQSVRLAPRISFDPVASASVIGQSVTFNVTAIGEETLRYQWLKDGAAIAGATGSTLTLTNVGASAAGGYAVVVTNSVGSVTSNAATLTLVAPRLSGVSVRTTLAAEQILIVGVNVAGGSKPALIRAAGPALGALGVSDTMADPKLALFNGQTQIAANDNWAGNAAVAAANAALGAFPFPSSASLDAALVSNIDGGRTVQVSGPTAGNLIVEVYDAGSGDTPRLTSVSALNRVGTGGDILIAGFTLTGSGTRNLLIRGVGPSLGALGVPGVLADPKLELFSAAAVPLQIGGNDNYASSLAPVFASVGSFALVPGGKDAAFTVSLPAGGYTVQVAGADGGTGTAIVEIYELP